jgi:serine/threonine protein kinase
MAYWAPELLKGDRATHKSDMWALGVSIFQMVTGVSPFETFDEDRFRDSVLQGNVDWSSFNGTDRIRSIVENLIEVDLFSRWDTNFVLSLIQEDFCIIIQKVFRGFLQRKKFKKASTSVVKM